MYIRYSSLRFFTRSSDKRRVHRHASDKVPWFPTYASTLGYFPKNIRPGFDARPLTVNITSVGFIMIPYAVTLIERERLMKLFRSYYVDSSHPITYRAEESHFQLRKMFRMRRENDQMIVMTNT